MGLGWEDGYVVSCFQEGKGEGSAHRSCTCSIGELVLFLFLKVFIAQGNILLSFTSKSFTWGLASDRRTETFF